MTTFTEDRPLPMRWPVPPTPTTSGGHIDIGLWPGGWKFLTQQDREAFEALRPDDRMAYARAFEDAAATV